MDSRASLQATSQRGTCSITEVAGGGTGGGFRRNEVVTDDTARETTDLSFEEDEDCTGVGFGRRVVNARFFTSLLGFAVVFPTASLVFFDLLPEPLVGKGDDPLVFLIAVSAPSAFFPPSPMIHQLPDWLRWSLTPRVFFGPLFPVRCEERISPASVNEVPTRETHSPYSS